MSSSLRSHSPALFTSNRDDWATPQALRVQIHNLFGPITLDAAASQTSTLVRSNWFGPSQCLPDRRDALALDWNEPRWHRRAEPRLVYLNPPYGRALPLWVDKAFACSDAGVPVLLLVPARTDTKWGQRLLTDAAEVIFLAGRLSFDNVGRAPFPSMLVLLSKNRLRTCEQSSSFDVLGTTMRSLDRIRRNSPASKVLRSQFDQGI
jgi:phage N-6-adenine-methyltransferase